MFILYVFSPLGLWLNSRAFLENYLLARKIRKSSGKDIEKLTYQEIRKVPVEASYLLRISGWSYVR